MTSFQPCPSPPFPHVTASSHSWVGTVSTCCTAAPSLELTNGLGEHCTCYTTSRYLLWKFNPHSLLNARLWSATAPMWACIRLVQPRSIIPVEAIGIFQRRSQHHRRTACILPSGRIACTCQNSDYIKKQKTPHFVKQLQLMKCTQNTKSKAPDLKYSGFLCPPVSH